jgi:glutamate--cysteine ligase
MNEANMAAVVETEEALVSYLASGCKPPSSWRIGTEHEKFGFRLSTHEPIPYWGPDGIQALLLQLAERFGWSPYYEGEHIIALEQDGASITLEPGGQFELSGAQLETIHQTCGEVGTHLSQLREVAGALGIGFLGLGFSPKWSLEETPIMPKGRYDIMRRYMAKVGRLGLQMMLRSCTVQTNLDFSSEADMRQKLRVSLALQPIATALFANSPFAEGRPNGFLSYRAHVWSDTDPDRTGMLPFAFEEGFGFERYVQYALDTPMYFVRREGRYIDAAGRSFRDFLRGALPELPGERPTLKDWQDHLTTMFPEVRLKTYLEMRGADSGPWSRLCAQPALWVGLLYDPGALDEATQLITEWTAADREALRRSVPAMGLEAPIRGRSAQAVARDVLAIARRGLAARAQRNPGGADETQFLSELEEIAETGVTPAGRLLEQYHGPWGRSVEPVFTRCAY